MRNQIPWVTSVTPSQLAPGAFTLTVDGSRFVNGAEVRWNGAPLVTTFVSGTRLVATGNATVGGPASVTVANPGPGAVSQSLVVTVASNVAVSVAPSGVNLATGEAAQFVASVTGSANGGVVWSVDGVVGGDASVGTISSSGLYRAPAILPPGRTVTVAAASVVDPSVQATATVSVHDVNAVRVGRFLDQATFGATAELRAHVAEIGIDAFLDEQFAAPESPWPNLATATRSDAIDAFFGNALQGADSLRQRVIFALSEIVVVAMNKNTNGNELVPWLQLLSRNAFGNYRTLLAELTRDASMGKYLDLANSGGMGAANENYPRELLQLFSIGLYELNPDGSLRRDENGETIPTYSQFDVQQLAKALTGWTYGNASGIPPVYPNYNYFPGPMLPIEARHDHSQKVVLGRTIAANGTAVEDLEEAIDIVFAHPNVGPFLATRLIRALVTSNPSPEYIARVTAAFDGDASHDRGDMKHVLRAILLDPEARDDDPPANFGRLRTPMQHTIALARSLGVQLPAASQFAYLYSDMNESLLNAPSVFGHYTPNFRIPRTALFGPEFQIYSSSDAINRANFFYGMLSQPYPVNPALQPLLAIAGNSARLVDAVDDALLFGRMSASTRASLLTALPAMPDNYSRVLTVVYLTAMSGEHLVQR